ncbi:hypothetical protein [Erythrobacter sp.]|uniref:hypothetical protein n=1 Tax=Erythrobacter sp. TaxID=1042 RepID=UPI001425E464|nr:hypothetical protein [Erythrobacter sp.]QIQ85631.1 MAG: hypothetical protein G9473_02225 [Erythrobacter sp.]
MTTAAPQPAENLVVKVLEPYGVDASSVSEQQRFIDEHIAQLEASDNETIARSGFVLKRASEGFGIGHKVPLAVMAMGQQMLGIDLAVATPFIASNPAAFTAAAMGAVYWGYQALEPEEREHLHRLIGQAFEFGVELVKTIAEFCIRTMRDLLDSEEFAQLRKYVAEFAEAVGSSLYDVTGRIYDRVTEIANSAGEAVSGAGSSVGSAASATINRGKALIWGNEEKDPEGKA